MPHIIEQELSEYLDKLLVTAGIERPRRLVPTDNNDGSMRFTTPARTKVRFIVSNNPKIKPHFTVTYKKSDCSFSLIDGSPLKTKLPPKFQHILGFVAQMWIERREQIIKVCQEKMGLKYVNNNQDEDDNLICDGWDIVPEHVLYRRPRPWLEKDQSTR